jgi:general secretion pathway protein H
MGAHRPHRATGRRIRGFTLVEMLVVLTVIGLMVAIVPPLMRLRAGDPRPIAHAIAADLRLLRDEAIRRDQITTFVPRATDYGLRPSGQTKSLPAGIALDFAAAPARLLPDAGELIDFFPDGSSTGGVLSVRRGESVARVLIRSFDGRVHLHE